MRCKQIVFYCFSLSKGNHGFGSCCLQKLHYCGVCACVWICKYKILTYLREKREMLRWRRIGNASSEYEMYNHNKIFEFHSCLQCHTVWWWCILLHFWWLPLQVHCVPVTTVVYWMMPLHLYTLGITFFALVMVPRIISPYHFSDASSSVAVEKNPKHTIIPVTFFVPTSFW